MLLNCIAEVRKAQGMSLRELARKLDMAPAILCRIEKGQRPVKDRQLLAIATVLGVTPPTLLLDVPLPCVCAKPRKRGVHV
jgi:Predicted transcriptional regulators